MEEGEHSFRMRFLGVIDGKVRWENFWRWLGRREDRGLRGFQEWGHPPRGYGFPDGFRIEVAAGERGLDIPLTAYVIEYIIDRWPGRSSSPMSLASGGMV